MTLGSGPTAEARGSRGLLVLALLAPLVGAAAGLVGAVFRLALERADQLAQPAASPGRTARAWRARWSCRRSARPRRLAAWLVRRFAPHASGSGIPHVEAVLARGAAASAVSA